MAKVTTNHPEKPKMSLLVLPNELIEQEIIPLLQISDIKALKLTCKTIYKMITDSSIIWHELFIKSFGAQPTPFSMDKWPELYKMRSRGKLYCWGGISGGRLAMSSQDVEPADHLVRDRFQVGVCRPTRVKKCDEVLGDVSCGGFSIQILTANGDIYCTGSSYYGGLGRDSGPGSHGEDVEVFRRVPGSFSGIRGNHTLFNMPDIGRLGNIPVHPHAVTPTRTVPVVMPVPMPRTIPPLRAADSSSANGEEKDGKMKNRFLTKQRTFNSKPTKFLSISSGRGHFIAIDNQAKVWSWDGENYGVCLKFINHSTGAELKYVLKVVAGWTFNCALLYGYGLVYWDSRDPLKEGDEQVLVNQVLISGTGDVSGDNKVVDFIAGENYIVYLTLKGDLYRSDMNGGSSVLLSKFHDYLKENGSSVKPKFTRITGSFKNFAVFSTEDIVLLGHGKSEEPVVVPELQSRGFINISVGDYHFLGLTEQGELYSWGVESNNCGCLGLGRLQGSNRVDTPTKVEVEGKVIAISAAGWHSCAIISN